MLPPQSNPPTPTPYGYYGGNMPPYFPPPQYGVGGVPSLPSGTLPGEDPAGRLGPSSAAGSVASTPGTP